MNSFQVHDIYLPLGGIFSEGTHRAQRLAVDAYGTWSMLVPYTGGFSYGWAARRLGVSLEVTFNVNKTPVGWVI